VIDRGTVVVAREEIRAVRHAMDRIVLAQRTIDRERVCQERWIKPLDVEALRQIAGRCVPVHRRLLGLDFVPMILAGRPRPGETGPTARTDGIVSRRLGRYTIREDGRFVTGCGARKSEDIDMGVLINGEWRDEELPQETDRGGQFKRADSLLRNRITSDGSSGLKAEAGRYHLYVAHGCPWAHRTLIYRALKKL